MDVAMLINGLGLSGSERIPPRERAKTSLVERWCGGWQEGAVKKRIENPELHSSFSISRQKIGSGGKKAHTSPYPKRRVFAGNQAAAIFFIFLLWYLYRLWPRATRRSSSFTQRSPFLTILLYHLSYFMTPKQPSAWMDRFIRRRAP